MGAKTKIAFNLFSKHVPFYRNRHYYVIHTSIKSADLLKDDRVFETIFKGESIYERKINLAEIFDKLPDYPKI